MRYINLITIFLILLNISSTAMASVRLSNYELCVFVKYADNLKKNNDIDEGSNFFKRNVVTPIVSGHAAIYIQKDSEVIKTYGYWPEDNLKINDDGDAPIKGVPTEHGAKIQQATHCRKIDRRTIKWVDHLANTYEKKYGDWGYTNHCIHFAVKVFEETTGVKVGGFVPKLLIRSIRSENSKESENQETFGSSYSEK